MKNSLGLGPSPLPRHGNISATLQRLMKSFAQLFALQRAEDEEPEMEIGFPTDVQHVTHIGIDGANKIGAAKNWVADPGFLSIPALDLEELELAMAGKPDEIVANESVKQGG
ncbi:CRIB domain-containing protein RIC4 [Canna indica]|uniref:CRIB domain-containing protein RIC4 n=1 Tax=Canna indica TaxID=4628 RepID=A0AAQ3KR41_9LILI|nr:CRIB domain-containing protein RIC4 [Canna indica]